MKNKTLLTLCAASMLLSVNAMAQELYEPIGLDKKGKAYPIGAVTLIGNNDDGYSIIISGDYNGDAFDGFTDYSKEHGISNVTEIFFGRDFTAKEPSTTVLPFDLPSGSTTNGKFYQLDYVIPDLRNGNRTWLAKMKYIGDNNLPEANKPYAVILPEGDELTFDLKGNSTTLVLNGNVSQAYNNNYNKNTNEVGFSAEELALIPDNNANDWYFVGTYISKDWGSSDPDNELGRCYGFEGSTDGEVSKGSFGKIVNSTKSSAFRAYLCKKDNTVQLPAPSYIKQNGGAAKSASVFSLPETINVEFVDTDANGVEHTAYIGKLNRIDNVRLNRERSTFDLKGRNVDGKRTAKGVYLKK